MAKFNDNDSSYFRPCDRDKQQTSTTLLVRLRDRDADAWKNFMEIYVPLIQYWCRLRKNILTRPERQDILLNVLQKVSVSVERFDPTREERNFRGWLRRITENQICDHLREKAKNNETLYSDPDDLFSALPNRTADNEPGDELDNEPDAEQEAGEQIVLLQQVLNRVKSEFRDKSWDVFHLLFVAEKDSSEVAEIMAMKSDAVRQIRSRILKRIREEYAKLGIETEMPNSF